MRNLLKYLKVIQIISEKTSITFLTIISLMKNVRIYMNLLKYGTQNSDSTIE